LIKFRKTCSICKEQHYYWHGAICIFCYYKRNELTIDDQLINRKADEKRAKDGQRLSEWVFEEDSNGRSKKKNGKIFRRE